MSGKPGAAVVGLLMGMNHCRACKAIEAVELRAVCDADAAHARQTAAELGVPIATSRFVEAALAGRPVPVDARDGALSRLVAHAVVASLRTRATMQMNHKELTWGSPAHAFGDPRVG